MKRGDLPFAFRWLHMCSRKRATKPARGRAAGTVSFPGEEVTLADVAYRKGGKAMTVSGGGEIFHIFFFDIIYMNINTHTYK